jgi:hypothetical protein
MKLHLRTSVDPGHGKASAELEIEVRRYDHIPPRQYLTQVAQLQRLIAAIDKRLPIDNHDVPW